MSPSDILSSRNRAYSALGSKLGVTVTIFEIFKITYNNNNISRFFFL